jgi:hypothetical protein
LSLNTAHHVAGCKPAALQVADFSSLEDFLQPAITDYLIDLQWKSIVERDPLYS